MKLSNMLLWSSLLVAAVPQAWAQANSIPSQPHLLVKGDASRKVMPDRFVVKIALESVDMQTDIARRKVQANAERTMALFARPWFGSCARKRLNRRAPYDYWLVFACTGSKPNRPQRTISRADLKPTLPSQQA